MNMGKYSGRTLILSLKTLLKKNTETFGRKVLCKDL